MKLGVRMLLIQESTRYTAMGWMRGTSGNLSMRIKDEPLRLAVTASGLDKGELQPADIVEIDGDGVAVTPGKQPSAGQSGVDSQGGGGAAEVPG